MEWRCSANSAFALVRSPTRYIAEAFSGHQCKKVRLRIADDQSLLLQPVKPSIALRRSNSAPTGSIFSDQQALDDYNFALSQEDVLTQRGAYQQRVYFHAITFAQRCTLVDWLAEMHDDLHLSPETLFLSVDYLDRFLAAQPTPLSMVQLAGLACVWLAAKLHEVAPPTSPELVAMADAAYSVEDLLHMEALVLRTLHYSLSVPTSYRLLHLLLPLLPLPAHPDAAAAVRGLAEALLHLALLDSEAAHHQPSEQAAAAAYLAMGMLGCGVELRGVVLMSGVGTDVLDTLVQSLLSLLHAKTSLHRDHEFSQALATRWALREGLTPPPPALPPCALVLRFIAWTNKHGYAAAPVPAQPATPPVPRDPFAQPTTPPPPRVQQQQAAMRRPHAAPPAAFISGAGEQVATAAVRCGKLMA